MGRTVAWVGCIATRVRILAFHIIFSTMLGVVAAGVIIFLWYPPPYGQILSGYRLAALVFLVNIVCGPALILTIFNPRKSQRKWREDLLVIGIIQISAFGFGLKTAADARPVYLAFEGNRFRLVQLSNIDVAHLADAPDDLRKLGFLGPKLIATQLLAPTDPAFPLSVQMSMQGIHPAFRPSRWGHYANQKVQVLATLRPLGELMQKNPGRLSDLKDVVNKSGRPEGELGYLPFDFDSVSNWVVIVDRVDALPRGYFEANGW